MNSNQESFQNESTYEDENIIRYDYSKTFSINLTRFTRNFYSQFNQPPPSVDPIHFTLLVKSVKSKQEKWLDMQDMWFVF